jgi:LSD1 subclass zinc finger protein
MADPVAALRVLTCPSCGAAVALERREKTHCVHCKAEVAIPEAHRLALELVEEQVVADQLTQRAFRVLGRPPILPLRAFAFINLAFTLFLCCWYVQAITWVEEKLFGWVEVHRHVNLYDWLTDEELWLLRWGALAVVCLVGVVLGALGRRRAVQRAALKAALHARAPAQAGGPALCRECGAPLSVPENSWGVRCAYCRTDNLVAISRAWLDTARRGVKGIAREARDALQQQRAVTYALRKDLLLNAGAVLLLAAVVEGFWLWERAEHPPEVDWNLRAALAGTRRMIGREFIGIGRPTPVPARIPLDGCQGHWRLPATDYGCFAGECWVGWFVALKAGEALMVAPQARGTMTLFKHVKDHIWQFSYGGLAYWGEQVGTAEVTPEAPGRIVAPVTDWYRVKFDLRLEAPEEGLPICAGVQ